MGMGNKNIERTERIQFILDTQKTLGYTDESFSTALKASLSTYKRVKSSTRRDNVSDSMINEFYNTCVKLLQEKEEKKKKEEDEAKRKEQLKAQEEERKNKEKELKQAEEKMKTAELNRQIYQKNLKAQEEERKNKEIELKQVEESERTAELKHQISLKELRRAELENIEEKVRIEKVKLELAKKRKIDELFDLNHALYEKSMNEDLEYTPELSDELEFYDEELYLNSKVFGAISDNDIVYTQDSGLKELITIARANSKFLGIYINEIGEGRIDEYDSLDMALSDILKAITPYESTISKKYSLSEFINEIRNEFTNPFNL